MWPELGMWRDETRVETGLGQAGPANPADDKELATRLGCYSHTRQAREQWLEVPGWTRPVSHAFQWTMLTPLMKRNLRPEKLVSLGQLPARERQSGDMGLGLLDVGT